MLDESTLVVDPVTGVPQTVQTMVDIKRPLVHAYAPTTHTVTAVTVGAWINSGRQPVVRAVLASGRSVSGTYQHPLLAPGGWRRLDALVVGETVPTAGSMPEPTSPAPLAASKERLAVLGRHRRGDPPDPIPAALSGSADSPVEDHRRLTKELLERVRDAEAVTT